MTTSGSPRQSQSVYLVAAGLAVAVSITGLVLGGALGWGLFLVGFIAVSVLTLVLRRKRRRGTGIYRRP